MNCCENEIYKWRIALKILYKNKNGSLAYLVLLLSMGVGAFVFSLFDEMPRILPRAANEAGSHEVLFRLLLELWPTLAVLAVTDDAVDDAVELVW